jgi:CRISPR-associated protein Cmr3
MSTMTPPTNTYAPCLLTGLDVALFRDGRPFSPAEFSRAQSIGATPPQETVYGALRHLLLAENGISYGDFAILTRGGPDKNDLAAQLGSISDPGDLLIGPVLLAANLGSECVSLLPFPADLIQHEEKGSHRYALLSPSNDATAKDTISNGPQGLRPLIPLFSPGARPVPSAASSKLSYETEGLLLPLRKEQLLDYLLPKSLDSIAPIHADSLIHREIRVGIALDPETRRPSEGALFTVEFHRPTFMDRDTGLDGAADAVYTLPVAMESVKFLNRAAPIGLGGERRPFHFQPNILKAAWWDKDNAPGLIAQSLARGVRTDAATGECTLRFRLVLLSPLPIGEGKESWNPPLPASIPGVAFTLIGAATRRPLSMSGWDLGRRQPKPGRAFVPAASVYFIEARWPNGPMDHLVAAQQIVNQFWFQSICPAGSPDARAGFGFTLIGACLNHA